MQTFIPHKNNPHKLRSFLGVFFVLIFSATLGYFAQGHIAKPKIVAQYQQPVNIAPQSKPEIATSVEVKNVPENKVQDSEAVAIPDSQNLATTLEEAQAPILSGPRSKDPKVALEEAKNFAKPQILEGKYIDVSLAHQNMVLFEDGNFVDSYLISSGKRGMETPVGTYHIQNKVPRAFSKSYGLYMPNWMALVPSGSFGIHELPEWPGGYKEGANHLGIPVSHGCVRLGVGAAKRVYDWTDVGTTVIVHK